MIFNSARFLIFFPIVVLFYYVIPQKLKNFWLLIASYFFYMCWNAKYVLLLLFSTIITYISGVLLEKMKSIDEYKTHSCKKLIVFLCFSVNLLILFYFKYFEFSLNMINKIFSYIHVQLNVPAFDIVLPVGISFYIFQALGYIMDVYRNDVCAEKNFFKYALFVSFFPQLVAGPIERSPNLLEQLRLHSKFDYDKVRDGMLLMLWGFFLKIVLADRIALFVDAVYGNYNVYVGWYLIIATLLFSVQIYCDFYGYSVIAIGAAEILGIHLIENFDAPYLSVSVTEFWRKWHISLTSWFRDYLYIPLGGNRKGKLRKYLNIFLVFLVSGLWHGARVSFIVWGGINGIYQIIGEIFRPIRDKIVKILHLNRECFSHKLVCIIATFLLVNFSWVFFRSEGIKEAFSIIRQMAVVKNPWILFDGSIYKCGLDSKNFCLMLICLGILLFADYCKHKGIQIRTVIAKQDYWFRWLFIAASICVILIFGIWGVGYSEMNFIYFQF